MKTQLQFHEKNWLKCYTLCNVKITRQIDLLLQYLRMVKFDNFFFFNSVGHAVLAVGPYTSVMDNGVSRKEKFASSLQETGDLYGDMFEVNTIRKEDFEFIKDKSGEFVDVLQCNNAPSSRTPRGHQFPAAFMHKVSGLSDHQLNADKPLKYSHLDVAGSSGDLPEPTTASSVVALAMHFIH